MDVRTSADSETGDAGTDISADRVFIASEDEAWEYEDVLDNKMNNMLLRDPGENVGTTEYISAEGDIVYYGYPSDMSGCYVRPMMWINSADATEQQ